MTSEPRLALERENRSRRGARDVLLLSTWCGLAAGLLEVGTRVSCRAIDPTDRLYWMSRHFVWLTPLANMLVFCCLGLSLAAITTIWSRAGRWFSPRIFAALTLLPMLMVAVPGIFPEAWFVLALGIASRVVPWLERRAAIVRSVLLWSFPVLLGCGRHLGAERIRGRLAQAASRGRPTLAADGFSQRSFYRA